MENKHILPEDMINAVEKYSFTCLFVIKKEKNITEKVILSMYKDNI